jgi:hypothetical protein
MNLGQARQELMDRGYEYLPAGRVDSMLNRGLNDFEDAWHWPWLQRIATGPVPLAVPDLRYILTVQDDTGNLMFGMVDNDDFDATQTGAPTGWWIDESTGVPTVTAWPVGDITFRVRYTAASSPLVAVTDTPSIPVAYHQLWVDLAQVHAYKETDNYAAASQLAQMTRQDLQLAIERFETRNRMNSQTILIRAGSEDD